MRHIPPRQIGDAPLTRNLLQRTGRAAGKFAFGVRRVRPSKFVN
jgi:hypothetical protein